MPVSTNISRAISALPVLDIKRRVDLKLVCPYMRTDVLIRDRSATESGVPLDAETKQTNTKSAVPEYVSGPVVHRRLAQDSIYLSF